MDLSLKRNSLVALCCRGRARASLQHKRAIRLAKHSHELGPKVIMNIMRIAIFTPILTIINHHWPPINHSYCVIRTCFFGQLQFWPDSPVRLHARRLWHWTSGRDASILGSQDHGCKANSYYPVAPCMVYLPTFR